MLLRILKAGFHMIANDRRRSQIVDDRKESCFYTIADDRSAEMSNGLARCACGKIRANNMADIEEETLLQGNLFLLFVLKRRQSQVQSVLDLKNIHEKTR